MPELPEVETIVRDLNKFLLNKTFSDVIVHDDLVLGGPSDEFVQRLKGQTVKKIFRRGKAVAMPLASEEFLVA